MSERYRDVERVLVNVLGLNLGVAAAKLALGWHIGSVSIVSDGFHSLTDSLSNVAAMVGVRVARRPPDEDHPYGHRKFETMAAGLIAGFLMLVVVEIVRAAVGRLRHGSDVQPTPLAFGVMLATMAVNLLVTRYEGRAARRLSSEVLLADATHTKSDVMTSLTVIGALAGTGLGFPWLDPVAALVIVGFIGYAGIEIGRATSNILADRMVIDADDVRETVLSVQGVLGCHEIRTRGSTDFAFLDLHIWMSAETRLDAAHTISHLVKDRLMQRFPQIGDAVIHIEPPPRDGDPRR